MSARIGLVTTSFPRHPGDYAGSFVGDRVRQLLAEGHAVDVLAAGDGGVTREMEHARLTVTRIGPLPAPRQTLCRGRDRGADPLPASGEREMLFYGAGAPEALESGGLAIWFEAVRFSAALAAAVRARAHRFDAVESHWLVPATLAALAGAGGRPHRAFAHSGDVSLLERIPFGRAIARRVVRDGVDLRFASDDLRARFTTLAGASGPVGAVAPMSPPAAEWAPRTGVDEAGRRQLGLARPTVLAVGRLVPIKGHDRLLRACARVQAGGMGGPGVPLEVVILGDGPERPRLEGLASRLGVPLRLPGFVPRAEVARWLRSSDVFVQASVQLPNGRSEGAPVATAEARAVGIPVLVASDIAGLAKGIKPIVTGV